MKFLSARTHTIIGLIVGVALIVLPSLLGYPDGPAVVVPIVIGVLTLLSELTTTSPLSPIKLIPMKIHIVVDILMGVFLALSPWAFGFYISGAHTWLPHFIAGILMSSYALLTNPADARVSVAANRTHTAH